jgi:transcriptional regulator of acetoin/glycerol metabolism
VPGGTVKEDLPEVMIAMAQQTEIKALQHQGFGPSAIAARLGVDRKTVRKDLTQDDFSPRHPPPGCRAPRNSIRMGR